MTATRKQFSLQLNTEKDADIIAYLESSENKTDAIRRAVLAQMKAEEA